jgi:putative transposase
MRRNPPLIPGSFYHVYNRGHGGAWIFIETKNYIFFLNRFRKYVADQHATVIAYVLMPNHYHFLLEIISDGFPHAFQNFTISYVKSINTRYQRKGTLFQGAFQAKLIDKDEYLLHLSRYIHFNPVKAGLVKQPQDYIFSSYQEYVGERNGTLPHPGIILSQFTRSKTSEVFGTSEVYDRYRSFTEDPENVREGLISHLLFD